MAAAALLTVLVVFAQFQALPAIKRRLTPLPVAQLLGQGGAPAAWPPVHGGHPADAYRVVPDAGNTLPRGDEERRRTLLVDLRARLRRTTQSAPAQSETFADELDAVLEREPLAVLEALAANLRPEDDLAFFLHSWAAVPSSIKLDFLTFRNVFDAERLDAASGTTARAAAAVLRSVHSAIRVVPGSSLAIEGVKYYSEEGITELLEVAYGSYLQLARTLWGMMTNAQRRAGGTRTIYTQAAAMSMTGPVAAVVLSHKGKSAVILKYMERRDVHSSKVNVASLGSHLARYGA
ncbi:hypothetical protein [Arthrobacter sp. NicSoilB4]|uniref:hypothetical protein n=1 Tax=Arthrobacter sp. NicSoilB4 TaxID=2830997 RepID=UPI001CC7910A|nr:hypothetical protein [Arthrobacter sp. NicSoilB4]